MTVQSILNALLAAIFFAVLLPLISQTAACQPAPRFTITDLGPPDGSYSVAYGINNKGQVVGEASGHAFLWQKGKMLDLGTLNGFPGSRATAINDQGQAVGIVQSKRQGQAGARTHAFLWQDGKMIDLGSLGGEDTQAYAINAKGWIVGKSYDTQSGFHAFLWQDGKMTVLSNSSDSDARSINDVGSVVGQEPYLRAENGSTGYSPFLGTNPTRGFAAFNRIRAIGRAINTEGQVVGEAIFAGEHGWHAFLYRSEQVVDLGTLGGLASAALALNNNVQVVGWSYIRIIKAVREIPRHAFLWTDGKMVDLNASLPPASGWILNEANGINDQGQIVGVGSIRRQTHAYLLTPVRQ